MLDDQKIDAQQILDELFGEHLLPFELSACLLDPLGSEEYEVRFHDSRLPWIQVSWRQGQCFKDVFRTAMLDRIERMNAGVNRKQQYVQTEN